MLGLDKVASPLTYTSAGDVISYTFTVTNTGAAILPGPVTISDPLVPGATCLALTTVGNNDAFFDPLEVMVCTGSYTIQASDVINGSVTNNAQASVAGFDSPTDSATVTLFVAEPTNVLAVDADFNSLPSPGDTLEYTVEISNTGISDLTGVTFNDTPGANTTLDDSGTVTTTLGTVTSGNAVGDASVAVDVGTVAVGVSVTITFRVTIDNPLPPGVTSVSNQGTVTTNETPDEPTDDPDTVSDEDETVTQIALLSNSIPDLGALGQMLLVLMLSLAGALMIRRRLI